ncbi:MAG: HAD hydrolase family protein [Tannerellaceae bacterium]|jgi:3-deoxy-D-manno-octulosonate 8-phosphate phosphatase (KDO 8-P phosphatase)|nr:HAD hydrolase family protein [Tannerellaceae bacterium]
MNLHLLIVDVDGTLTDATVFYGDGNIEIKAFNTRDGLGLLFIRSIGVSVVLLTGRESEAVARRAIDLGVTVVQNIADKAVALRRLLAEHDVTREQTAYIGDDLNDYAAMSLCGYKACPADASTAIKAIADYVSPLLGGHGAVRDIVEKLLIDNGRWDELLAAYGVSC